MSHHINNIALNVCTLKRTKHWLYVEPKYVPLVERLHTLNIITFHIREIVENCMETLKCIFFYSFPILFRCVYTIKS